MDGEAAPRQLGVLQGFPQGVAWAADTSRLLVSNESGEGSGVWQLDMEGHLTAPVVPEDSTGPGIDARAGRVVYARARQVIDIWKVAVDVTLKAQAHPWIASTRQQLTPQFSPDGARIAFQSNRSGTPEIWLADADGHNEVRLTNFNGPLTGGPSWCADGRRLAFDARDSRASGVYVVDVLERVPRRVPTTESNLALPVWSSDCDSLLASDVRGILFSLPVQGGAARRFTAKRSYLAAVAGDRVVFNVAEPAGVRLWIKALSAGEEQPLADIPTLSYADSWTAGNGAVYFTDIARTPVKIYRYDLATRARDAVASLPNVPSPLGGLGLAVSPNGKTLLYTHTEDVQSDLFLATIY
jgi:dipeptidyl aminopeptidase/acylaminoacyl peptidase